MKISVLSPVRNEQKYISEMIESILAQDHHDFELIIVDDGSTDETVAIATRYARKDERIRIFGVGGTRGKVQSFNLAYEQSSGAVVVLLAGDDRVLKNSLSVRVATVESALKVGNKVAAFFKLRTFSTEHKFDGIVIPRGAKTSRSGGAMALSRELADEIFPIAKDLIAEDIWISELCSLLADTIAEEATIVLDYRIHSGNSHPRQSDFETMTEAMHLRMLPYNRILDSEKFELSAHQRQGLEALVELENRRYARDTLSLFFVRGVRLIDKLRALSSSTKVLYRLRSHFYRLFSGW